MWLQYHVPLHCPKEKEKKRKIKLLVFKRPIISRSFILRWDFKAVPPSFRNCLEKIPYIRFNSQDSRKLVNRLSFKLCELIQGLILGQLVVATTHWNGTRSLLTSAKLSVGYLVVGITRELDKEPSLYYPLYIYMAPGPCYNNIYLALKSILLPHVLLLIHMCFP